MIDGGLGLDWQSSVETSSFVAVNGNGYFVNTTSGSITVTMPSSPTVGDSIGIIDYAGTAASNTITLTSSNNIQGSSDNKIVNYTRGALRITYADTTQGWVASAAANDGTSALNPSPLLVDYLVVAGGAGGGIGGGGAGGLLTNYLGTPLVLNLATAYTVEIGVGGNGSANGSQSKSGNGGNSKFGVVGSEIIATGGGGAGTGGAIGAYNNGANGGSGGGSHANGTAGTATPAGQGFAGSVGDSAGGAGGGASTGGSVPTEYGGGNGGAGITSLISGVSSDYAGGGGGIAYSTGTAGTASDGGGAGVYGFTATGISGTPNTGGGGGGSNGGSSGGSGVVILRYPTAKVSSFAVTGTLNTPTPSIVGTDSVLIFTTGTGTITFS